MKHESFDFQAAANILAAMFFALWLFVGLKIVFGADFGASPQRIQSLKDIFESFTHMAIAVVTGLLIKTAVERARAKGELEKASIDSLRVAIKGIQDAETKLLHMTTEYQAALDKLESIPSTTDPDSPEWAVLKEFAHDADGKAEELHKSFSDKLNENCGFIPTPQMEDLIFVSVLYFGFFRSCKARDLDWLKKNNFMSHISMSTEKIFRHLLKIESSHNPFEFNTARPKILRNIAPEDARIVFSENFKRFQDSGLLELWMNRKI